MPASEFSIIKEYFTLASDVGIPPIVGIGDDCAVLDIPDSKQLAVSTDTLVEGVHFLANSDPTLLGHKVLAVNLSDLAAMGATPAWVSLAITLPSIDKPWLSSFSKGFFALAEKHSLRLIGGDTTRGPLSITITIMGLLAKNQRLTRSTANVGDSVYVSGYIGNAGLGLQKARLGVSDLNDADLVSYLTPVPRVSLGEALLTVATSCIDVSDGLSADLNHILSLSGVGATIEHNALPLTPSVQEHILKLDDELWPYSTGDDYELCFTAPERLKIESMREFSSYKITKIGVIEKKLGLRVKKSTGSTVVLDKGYQHFND